MSTAPTPGAPLLMDAVLTPNRSLPRAGFWALMAAILAAAVLAGVFYVSLGAWPVLGFFGLDIALIVLAFHLSYRQGRIAETVRITPERVKVVRRHPNGREQTFESVPIWTQVDVEQQGDHGVRVVLRSRGEGAILGAFLSPHEREDFAKALVRALDQARQGVPTRDEHT